jgi:hypothetical protein
MTNIYETMKVNDPRRRTDLAYIQAILSQGSVFRARKARLTREFAAILRQAANLPPEQPPARWFLSEVFLEAVAERDDGLTIPDLMLSVIREQPAEALFQYLTNTPEDTRLDGVRRWTEGSKSLCEAIEKRRAQHRNEPISVRRKIYSVLLAIDFVDLIAQCARSAGFPWTSTSAMDPVPFRKVVREAPAFHVEREITLRLEMQDRVITHNDLRDMQSFAAVVPYADLVIAENQFINLAKQAGMEEAYGGKLRTDILSLAALPAVAAGRLGADRGLRRALPVLGHSVFLGDAAKAVDRPAVAECGLMFARPADGQGAASERQQGQQRQESAV